jgi:hypothetical protein
VESEKIIEKTNGRLMMSLKRTTTIRAFVILSRIT